MKKALINLLTFFVITGLFACGNRPAAEHAVQHDTLSSNAKPTSSVQDTVIASGEYIKHYKNGVIEMRGMMKDGKRDGLWKSWYQNGSPWSETTFKNGRKNGPTTTWYENEQKRYQGFYTDDMESGKWILWDEKGRLVKEIDYDKIK